MKPLILSLFTILSLHAQAHRVGNGGDHVRATFIQMGEAVMDVLKNTETGQKLIQKHQLKPDEIEATLDILKIQVTDEQLRDNSGSLVEAIGEPGNIQLNKEIWFQHFEKSTDIYYLVFHEMLRSAAVDDDNYIISKALHPFPASRKIAAKVSSIVPLIPEDNLSNIVDLSKVAVNGNGCPVTLSGTMVSFDSEKNALEILTRRFVNDSQGRKTVQRKSCSIAIPVNLPATKRLVISQLDISGKVNLQAQSQTQIGFEAFLAGQTNRLKTKVIKASQPMTGRFLMRRTEVLKSNCGSQDLVRINSSLFSQSQQGLPESSEIGEIQLSLSLEDCQ